MADVGMSKTSRGTKTTRSSRAKGGTSGAPAESNGTAAKRTNGSPTAVPAETKAATTKGAAVATKAAAAPPTRHLFGTDGIRGTANEWPITPELALSLGK